MNNLLEYLQSRRCKGFKPIPRRNEDGNLIEWFWKDEEAYSESIHENGKWVGSVHRSMKTDEVVGVSIHLEAVK